MFFKWPQRDICKLSSETLANHLLQKERKKENERLEERKKNAWNILAYFYFLSVQPRDERTTEKNAVQRTGRQTAFEATSLALFKTLLSHAPLGANIRSTCQPCRITGALKLVSCGRARLVLFVSLCGRCNGTCATCRRGRASAALSLFQRVLAHTCFRTTWTAGPSCLRFQVTALRGYPALAEQGLRLHCFHRQSSGHVDVLRECLPSCLLLVPGGLR